MTVTPRAGDLSRPGTLLGGRYALGAVLGHGGMSTVYRALDRQTDQAVAIKIFHPGVELSDSLPRRRREVQVAAALNHPAIVRVLDADVERSDQFGGRAYIVTELVEGPTLAQRVHAQPLSEIEAARLGAVLCDALTYMHQQGIVHRDLKPANILLASNAPDDLADPKLADFGLAYMVDSTRMTGIGLTAGTPNYLSPEQVRGRAISPASDIYALGLVLIEAMTGIPVFAGHGVEAALARLSNDPRPPTGLTPRFTRLLRSMTHSDPARRPTAAAVDTELRGLGAASLTSELTAFGPVPTTVRPAPRWRRFGLLAATLSLVGAGTVGAIVVALSSLVGGSGPAPTAPGNAAVLAPSSPVTSAGAAQAGTASSPPATIASTTVAIPGAAIGPPVSSPAPTTAGPVARSSAQPAGKGHGKKKSGGH